MIYLGIMYPRGMFFAVDSRKFRYRKEESGRKGIGWEKTQEINGNL